LNIRPSNLEIQIQLRCALSGLVKL